MKFWFQSLIFTLLLFVLGSCRDVRIDYRPPQAASTAQYYVPFTTFAANLSPVGCAISLQTVKWPSFGIKEVAQDLTTCMVGADLYVPTSTYTQAATSSGDIVFFTHAANIVPGINSGRTHIYYWNHDDGQIELISKGLAGAEADNDSNPATVSSDGQYVCYNSGASNIVPGDTNGVSDTFLYDRRNQTTIRVQRGTTQPNGQSQACSISRDGKFLAFISSATNLVAGDTNALPDAFVYDIATKAIERVSVTSSEAQSSYDTYNIFISGTGRFVVFISDQLDSDAVGWDVFLRDRQTGKTHRVSKAFDGGPLDNTPMYPSVDDSGRYISYATLATNVLSTPSVNGHSYFYDRSSGTTTLISKALAGGYANGFGGNPNLSPDGKYIFFTSDGTDLVSETVSQISMYVYDVATGKVDLISKKADGTLADGSSLVEF